MLHAKLSNVSEWKAIVSGIGDIVEEAMFIISQDGITFRGMDPAHVSLLDVTFPKESFESDKSQATFFSINIADFKAILNSCANEDILEFLISESHKMKIVTGGTMHMEFNLRLLDRTQSNIPIPVASPTVQVAIVPAAFTKILSNMNVISDYISIKSESDKIQFQGTGDSGDATITLDKGSPELEKLEIKKVADTTYSLEYMAKIIRDIGKASKNINLEYSEQHPMHMTFVMPSKIKVNYYLAPRVEN